MGYLTVLHVKLGAKIGDLCTKDSKAFRKQQMYPIFAINFATVLRYKSTSLKYSRGKLQKVSMVQDWQRQTQLKVLGQ